MDTYFFFRELDEDIDLAILYSIIFINAVNKHFKKLINPRIKLSFSGIIIGTVRICYVYSLIYYVHS